MSYSGFLKKIYKLFVHARLKIKRPSLSLCSLKSTTLGTGAVLDTAESKTDLVPALPELGVLGETPLLIR